MKFLGFVIAQAHDPRYAHSPWYDGQLKTHPELLATSVFTLLLVFLIIVGLRWFTD